MASGANAYLQMPTSAINKILANSPKMFNTELDNNGFNSLSKLNQLSKADALATNNAAQAAESQVPSLARKAGRIVGNGINATKGALGRVVMTPSLAALGGAAAEIVPVAGVVGSLGGAYASARGEQMDNDPVVQQEKAIRANAIKNGWTPDDEDNWTNAQGQTVTYNDIYGMYGPEGTALGPDKTLDITPSIYTGSVGNYKIGLTPQTQELIALKKQENTPQVTTTPTTTTTQTKTVATPSTDIDSLVKATLRGDYGNGADRKKALGANYDAVQKAINGTNLPKASGSKTSKAKEPSVAENLNKNSGNWMDTLNSLLPFLALAGGAYYMGKR